MKKRTVLYPIFALLLPHSTPADFDLGSYLDSGSYVSFLDDIQRSFEVSIPGLGSIALSCSTPSFILDYSKFSLCGIEDAVYSKVDDAFSSLGLDDLGNFTLGDESCGFSMKTTFKSCEALSISQLCKSADSEMSSLLEIDKLKSGIGAYSNLSSHKISSYGGKELFGEEVCGDAEERLKSMESDIMQSIYGESTFWEKSWLDKMLEDKGIGGNASYLNTREGKSFLRCIEVAKNKNLSTDICRLGSTETIPDLDSSSISHDMLISSSTNAQSDLTSSAGLSTNASSFFPLFVKYSKEFKIENPKILLAVGMQESGGKMNVNAKNPNKNSSGEITSTDWGMMQINDKAQKDNFKSLYPNAGFMGDALRVERSGRGAIDRSIRMGALVLSKCIEKFGQDSWNAVDCYNKGAGGASKNLREGYSGFQSYGGGMAYINGVKKWYAKIGGLDMKEISGDNTSFYASKLETTQNVANFSSLSELATEHSRTLSHTGQDFIDNHLPKEKKVEYVQLVNRYMAQKTFIEAGFKRIAELSKRVQDTFSFGSEMQSKGSSDEAMAGGE